MPSTRENCMSGTASGFSTTCVCVCVCVCVVLAVHFFSMVACRLKNTLQPRMFWYYISFSDDLPQCL